MTAKLNSMAHRLVAGVLVAGMAAALAWHFAAGPTGEPQRAAAPAPATDDAAPGAEVAAAAGRGAPLEPPHRAVRDVTPHGIARVYMSPSEERPRRAAPSASSIQITHAGVMPDGAISGEGGTVHLHGVAWPDAMKICTTASGERWACGRRAYITLHNKLFAQTVHCEPRAADPSAAECFVGDANLAVWLIGQGLARVASQAADPELVAAEAAARNGKLGLWADPHETAASAADAPRGRQE